MEKQILSVGQINDYIKNKLDNDPGLEVVFSGGVASNSMLRELTKPLKPVFAQPQYSTDNAMGVAILAHRLLEG